MRIQAVVVFIGLLLALAAGVFAGGWYGASPVAGWLAVGSVPVVWGLLHLIERAMGREIWHYSAPYPYPWMHAAATDGENAAQAMPESESADLASEQYAQAA
jgi:hypothetical protein